MDFLLTWVDGSDEDWLTEKQRYLPENAPQASSQYREWDILQYWFRSVEKFAPWVDQIYFVTCGQTPPWLNTEHPKLKLVNHKDFIPAEYLPTFSSHTIELNLHRIPGLSEQFVYFNDDTYLAAPVTESDFFENGNPKFSAVMSALTPYVPSDPFMHYLCNDLSVINAHFSKRAVLKQHFSKWYSPKYGKSLLKNIYYGVLSKFTGFYNCHNPSSMLKSVYETVWKKEYELLDRTCRNKFRQMSDVNQYVMSYYGACLGKFSPASIHRSRCFSIGCDDDQICDAFLSNAYKMICVNDNPNQIDFEAEQQKIKEIFEVVFPEKSSFEK